MSCAIIWWGQSHIHIIWTAYNNHIHIYAGAVSQRQTEQWVYRLKRRGASRKSIRMVNIVDMWNWAAQHTLPSRIDDLRDEQLYAVQMPYTAYKSTRALALVTKRHVGWTMQLGRGELARKWSVKADAKHKLSFDKWLMLTIGCHSITWEDDSADFRKQFRPLMMLLTKEQETVESVQLAGDAIQFVYGRYRSDSDPFRFLPDCLSMDHSAGIRRGLQLSMALDVYPPFGPTRDGPPEGEEATDTVVLNDYAHFARKLRTGELIRCGSAVTCRCVLHLH